MRLIIDSGTLALRNVLQKCHPGKSIKQILAPEKKYLRRLKFKVINQTQWDILYPSAPLPNIPDINNFDITLLSILLRNICRLTAPATGWDEMPNASDNSDVANIIRIKLFRNKVHAHISKTEVETTKFEDCWKEISSALVSLGIDQSEIDRIKDEECGREIIGRVTKAWNAMEDDLKRIEIGQEEALKRLERIEQGQKDNKRCLEDLKEQQKELKSGENRQVNRDNVLKKSLDVILLQKERYFTVQKIFKWYL